MKVTEMTVEELKNLIKHTVQEEFQRLLEDPDQDLELSTEIEKRLQSSLASTTRISFQEAKKRFNLP